MGRLHLWVRYGTNDVVRCPGIKERRQQYRGDRRADARPCPETFGRVGPDTEFWVRVQPRGEVSSALIVPCSECGARVEIRQTIATKAA